MDLKEYNKICKQLVQGEKTVNDFKTFIELTPEQQKEFCYQLVVYGAVVVKQTPIDYMSGVIGYEIVDPKLLFTEEAQK